MADTILADKRHTTTREAILQRTTRGMLTYNTGKVHRLEGELWAVPSTRGGFHQVDLSREECDCEDFTFYGRDRGVACRHIYAAAIARAADARRRRQPLERAKVNKHPMIRKLSPERRAALRAGLDRMVANMEEVQMD